MAKYLVVADCWSYATSDEVKVEANNEFEAEELALDELMWIYDNVEITDVIKLDDDDEEE